MRLERSATFFSTVNDSSSEVTRTIESFLSADIACECWKWEVVEGVLVQGRPYARGASTVDEEWVDVDGEDDE